MKIQILLLFLASLGAIKLSAQQYDYNEAGELVLMPAFFNIGNDEATIEILQRVGNVKTEAYWLVDISLKQGIGWLKDTPVSPDGKLKCLLKIQNSIPKHYNKLRYTPNSMQFWVNINGKNLYSHVYLDTSGIFHFQSDQLNANQYIQRFYKHDFEGNIIWEKEIDIDFIPQKKFTDYDKYFTSYAQSLLSIDDIGNLYFFSAPTFKNSDSFTIRFIEKNIFYLDNQTGNIIWQEKINTKKRGSFDCLFNAQNNGVYLLGGTNKKNNTVLSIERINADKNWRLEIGKKYIKGNFIHVFNQYTTDNEGNIYLIIIGRNSLSQKKTIPSRKLIHLFKISPNGKVIWHKQYGENLWHIVKERGFVLEILLSYDQHDIILSDNKLYVYLVSDIERVDLINSTLPEPKSLPVLGENYGTNRVAEHFGRDGTYEFVLVFDANTGQLEAGKYLNRDE